MINSDTGLTTRILYKKLISVCSLLLISLEIFAGTPLASRQQIGMFRDSKTCVVFEDGVSQYNAYIKDAVQKYWKSTNYEFIDHTEFDKRKTDSKYSFIVLMDGAFDKDPGGVRYSYISLLLGDASGILAKMPEYCSIPLTYSGDNATDYEYIMPSVVKFMQIHVKNLEKDRLSISLSGLKFYNKSGYTGKVLLLNKEKIAANADSPDKIRKVYPGSFKLLSITEIQKEVAANEADMLFLFHVGPPQNSGSGKCFEMIFDTEGNLYYYNFRKITNDNTDGFNLNDFKKIR